MSGDSGGRGGGGRGKRSKGVRESARGVIDKSARWVGREGREGGAGFESQIERERHTPTHTHKAREADGGWVVGLLVTMRGQRQSRRSASQHSTALEHQGREGKGKETEESV